MFSVTPAGNQPAIAPGGRRHALEAAARWFGGVAPMVYLLTALPTVVFLTTLTPPFQTPDETNHFRRAVQLLRGGIVGHEVVAPGWSGAHLPKNVGKVAEAFSYLIGHPENKFSPVIMRDTLAIPWDWSDREFASFANTVIYPPFYYGPAIEALAIARQLGWGVLDAYELARLSTGVMAVLLATWAIGIAMRGRAVLFAVLSLPTTLYLFASMSQDALLIAGTGLAMGYCSRAAGQARALTAIERVIVAVLLGAAAAARPPYVFLLAVLATPLVRSGADAAGIWKRWITPALPLAAALAIGLGWITFGARPAQTPMRSEAGVSIPGQLSFSLQHPTAFPAALLNTLSNHYGTELEQAIGVLGWSDALLPPFVYLMAGVALTIAIALALTERRGLLTLTSGIGLLVAGLLTFVSLYGALYLSWTPVGAGYVDGFQGRYILPASTLLAVALPALGARVGMARANGRVAESCRLAAWVAFGAFVVASDLWLPHQVFLRYYG